MTFYNEIDPYCVQWIKRLSDAGHIAPGVVNPKSIATLLPGEVRHWAQCHFFAGVAVWSYALRCAGWPDDREVWTGSCPCQPFSCAGKRKGTADHRHLWPEWFRLIRELRPVTIFGEQVGSKDGIAWFDVVQTDLESCGYTVGAVVAPAAGFGAPHIRQRLYFVAVAGGKRFNGQPVCLQSGRPHEESIEAAGSSTINGFWSDAEWIACTDGKSRAAKPGTFPLAHGATARVGRLRAYGNAIVAAQATEFIRAFMEIQNSHP